MWRSFLITVETAGLDCRDDAVADHMTFVR